MSNRLSLRILSRHVHDDPDVEGYGVNFEHLQLHQGGQTIGNMRLIVIEAEKVWQADQSLFDSCDVYDDDVSHYYWAIYESLKKRLNPTLRKMFPYQMNRNVLIIHWLKIPPHFRGKGLGLIAMEQAMLSWKKVCGLAVIKPFPLGPYKFDKQGNPVNKAKFEKACQKLVDYYKVFGFKRVGASGYYVLSLEDKLP